MRHLVKGLALAVGLMGCAVCSASERWLEISDPHFKVLTNSSEKDARKTLHQLERIRWLIQTVFPKLNLGTPEPIVVVAAKGDTSFGKFEPVGVKKSRDSQPAGLYIDIAQRKYILVNLDDETIETPERLIFHEFTHFAFRRAGRWVPAWISEGFADFLGESVIEKDAILLASPDRDEIYGLAADNLIPTERLLRVDYSSPEMRVEAKEWIFYAESWFLVDYLEMSDRQNRTNRYGKYLSLCESGLDPFDAGKQAFGDLKHLDLELKGYINNYYNELRNGEVRELRMRVTSPPPEEPNDPVRILTDLEKDAALCQVLIDLSRPDAAEKMAQEISMSDPSNPIPKEIFGLKAALAEKNAESEKWFKEALDSGADDYTSHVIYAAVLMEKFDEAQGGEIERHLRAAIRLNPEDGWPYFKLAKLFLLEHKNLEEAHHLSVQAIYLNPYSTPTRLCAAEILKEMGRTEDSVRVLREALKFAYDKGDRKKIEEDMEKLQKDGVKPPVSRTVPQ